MLEHGGKIRLKPRLDEYGRKSVLTNAVYYDSKSSAIPSRTPDESQFQAFF